MPDITARRTVLRLQFLIRMYTQEEAGIGEIWKEDAKRAFPALRSVRLDGGEARRVPPDEGSFYRECRKALKVFLRVKNRLSDTQPLSRKALYQILVREGVPNDEQIELLGLTGEEKRSLWPWAPGLRSLTNPEASLTWLTIRNALWVGTRLKKAKLVDTPACERCGDWEETVEHAFYHCRFARPLCELVEGYMVRILRRPDFKLEASNVCSNVTPLLEKKEKYIFLCLLGLLRVVIWTTRQKGCFDDEFFSPGQLVAFLRHSVKVKIRSERKRLDRRAFNERWVKVAQLCRVNGTKLEFFL